MIPFFSITAANINSPEWAELLIKSVRKYTTVPYEIIIIDNGSLERHKAYLRAEASAGRIRLHENPGNKTHGGALDQGTALAQGVYICAMDIDAFFLRPGWDTDILALYQSNPKTRMIARRGGKLSVTSKPFGGGIFFYETEFARTLNMKFIYDPATRKGSTDSMQGAYWQIVDAGYDVNFLKGIGPLAQNPGGGDIIELAGKPTIYHHFYGSRFSENDATRTPKVMDGRTLESHLARKAELFSQPIVREILETRTGE